MAVDKSRFSKKIVKSASFTGTTNANGDVTLSPSVNVSSRVILQIVDSAFNRYVPFVNTSGNWCALVMTTSGTTVNSLINTEVSGTYYYIDAY